MVTLKTKLKFEKQKTRELREILARQLAQEKELKSFSFKKKKRAKWKKKESNIMRQLAQEKKWLKCSKK